MGRKAGIWWRAGEKAWYVKIGGKQVRLSPDKKKAEKLFHKLKAEEDEKRPVAAHPLLACEVCDRFLAWCYKHREQRTADGYKYFLERFLKWLPRGKEMTAAELKPYHVVEYMDSGDWGDSYKRNVGGAVQRAFKWAVAVGLIDMHPCTYIPKPKGTRRETPMSDEEYKIVLKHSDEHFGDAVRFARESGVRPQEIRTLRPEYVDLKERRIVFPIKSSKGKKRQRVIYLNRTAKAILKRRLQKKQEWVFTNRSGRQWTAYAWNCRFHRLYKSGKTDRKLCMYLIRHGYGTRKLLEGHSVETVAALMGHQSAQMLHSVYGHIDRAHEHLREAAE